jgi:hypothetical protein
MCGKGAPHTRPTPVISEALLNSQASTRPLRSATGKAQAVRHEFHRSGKQVRHSNRGHKHTSLCIASALSGCAKGGNKHPFG